MIFISHRRIIKQAIFVVKFAARKIGSALRGRPLTVEDHTWTPSPGDYETWIARTTRGADAYAAMRVERCKQRSLNR